MLQDDVYLLKRLGPDLDFRPHFTQSPSGLLVPLTVRDWLIGHTLKIRDRDGAIRLLTLNRAQLEYSRRCTLKNIILKARQLGMTTYVAARFFIETITHPGSLTVQVAQDQESAEQIFRIVHRFWENLPGRSGGDKKEAALSFVGAALSMGEAVAAKDIVDENKFHDGLSKVIDGTVDCLNASLWAKKK
jgi:hypothetical protein